MQQIQFQSPSDPGFLEWLHSNPDKLNLLLAKIPQRNSEISRSLIMGEPINQVALAQGLTVRRTRQIHRDNIRSIFRALNSPGKWVDPRACPECGRRRWDARRRCLVCLSHQCEGLIDLGFSSGVARKLAAAGISTKNIDSIPTPDILKASGLKRLPPTLKK